MSFDGEALTAALQWVDENSATNPVVIDSDESSVTFTTEVEATVGFQAYFTFYVKDCIDKDYMSLGSTEAYTEDRIDFQLVVTVLRNLESEDRVVNVEVADKNLTVNFGYIEPFYEDPTHEKY